MKGFDENSKRYLDPPIVKTTLTNTPRLPGSGLVVPYEESDARGEAGAKFDDGKARYDLIPPEALEALAERYSVGASKYGERNWEKGMSWGRFFGGLMRHAWAWMRGEDYDPQDRGHHLIAVAWCAMAIYTYQIREIGKDDRP